MKKVFVQRPMKTFRILLAVTAGLLTANSAPAQTWMLTSAPTNRWLSVASSADGTKLIAAVNSYAFLTRAPGPIYISTNSGATWTQSAAPSNYWQSVASSADGANLFAVPYLVYNTIYISTNSGASWSSNYVSNVPAWWRITCSADGSKLAGIVFDSSNNFWIFTSTNSGLTWIQTTAPETNWNCIASSADGSKIVAGVWSPGNTQAGGSIYTSTNSGATWTRTSAPINEWVSVASSADGTKLVAVGQGFLFNVNPIFTSTDSGVTWTPFYFQNRRLWTGIASSADGTKLVAVNEDSKGDGIYASTDSGASWTVSNASSNAWNAVASSADGSKFVSVNTTTIWTSQSIPAPQLNLAPSGSNLTVSWIVPSANFVLQQNLDLTTTNWTDVTNPPVLNLTNLQDEVALPMAAGSGFYRLKTP